MADYDSGLPIRSEADGADERVHVKIVDKDNPDTQQTTVDTNGNLYVKLYGGDPGSVNRAFRSSEQGHFAINGLYDAATNTDPSNIGMIAHVRAASPADSDQTKRITAISSGSVHALDISLHDESGNPFSASNPLPVAIQESENTEVHDYNTASGVAAAATSNHDYSVADGTTFLVYGIVAAASGKLKIELQIGDGAVSEAFASKAVKFNSTAEPNCDLYLFNKPIKVIGTANTTTIRVIRTNRDNQAQDLYTTIVGIAL